MRILGERTEPLPLELARLPRAGLPRERGEMAGLRALSVQGCLPMLFFKANCLCCQERVCPSLGDRGCQAQNSKHVKNSSASRLRGCNFLLKYRLHSRQKSRGLSMLPAACSRGCWGRQSVCWGNPLHSNNDEFGVVFKSVFVVINLIKGRSQIGYKVAKVRPVLMILRIVKAPFLFCSGNKGVTVLFGSVTSKFKPLP